MKLILACDPCGGIGYNNNLPWDKITGDLQRFKVLTTGQVIVMGRNTWESLSKKPLPNRLNVVVSTNSLDLPDGAMQVSNLNHFRHFTNSWLIGGAKLVNTSWHLVDEIHLTRTFNHYTCDSFIDLLYLENNYVRVHTQNNIDHSYEIWKRKDGTVSQLT